MGQVEVFEWFRIQYLTGNKSFFGVEEIKRIMRSQGYLLGGENRALLLYRYVKRLYAYGFLDIKVKFGEPVRYRVKEKYVRLKESLNRSR